MVWVRTGFEEYVMQVGQNLRPAGEDRFLGTNRTAEAKL